MQLNSCIRLNVVLQFMPLVLRYSQYPLLDFSRGLA